MLEKFTIMDLIHSRSNSVATVKEKAIKFTAATAIELGSPAYVQFLVQAKKKQFAIRPCKEDAPNAVKFVKPEVTRNYPVTLTLPAIVAHIRSIAGWEDGAIWCIPGVYAAEDNALIFDVAAARPPQTRAKRRKAEATEEHDAEGQAEPGAVGQAVEAPQRQTEVTEQVQAAEETQAQAAVLTVPQPQAGAEP